MTNMTPSPLGKYFEDFEVGEEVIHVGCPAKYLKRVRED